uniref:Vacuolar ATPase assembly factor VMA21 n=2 Tax=Leporidae TaxID=9979 RepID=A0A5F9DMY9_RABIT
MWSGWATRPACSWSTGRPWQGARRGAPIGKSRDAPPGPRAGVCSLASPRRAALARCCPERRSASGPANLDLSPAQRPPTSAPSCQQSARCRHRDAMERLDKAALNALQPPEFRSENSLASTLKTLLFFTALMITVPIGLYFTTKSYIFEGALGMSNRDSYFYAAIVAVVAVHVVLALFVYVAWNEGSRQWREGKQD